MPDTAVDTKRSPMEEFKEQLSQRVRNDIRELLPEDAVNSMVEEAVRDTFFKPRLERSDHYSSRTVERPSWFVEAVAKAAEPILRDAIDQFLLENRDVVEKAVNEYLTPQNLTVVAVDRLSQQIGMALDNLAMSIRERG